MPLDIDPGLLLGLFGVAVGAGCVDAIAGGGGLMTLPALILAGLDPVSAIATNKLQGTAGSVSATGSRPSSPSCASDSMDCSM
mgnify:CR=1 FL=1